DDGSEMLAVPADLASLAHKALDGANLAERFVCLTHGLGHPVLDSRAGPAKGAAEDKSCRHDDRHHLERRNSESRVAIREEHDPAHDENDLPEELGRVRAADGLQHHEVAGQAARQLATPILREEGGGEPDEMREQILAKLRDDAL